MNKTALGSLELVWFYWTLF